VILADRLWGILALLGGLAIVAHARTFPKLPGQPYGSALMPTVIGLGFVLCGLLLVVADLRRPPPRPSLVHLAQGRRAPGRLVDVLAVPLATAAFVPLAPQLGFVPTATLLVGLLIRRYRRRHTLAAFALALAVALAVDALFRHLLLVPLPPGPLAGILP